MPFYRARLTELDGQRAARSEPSACVAEPALRQHGATRPRQRRMRFGNGGAGPSSRVGLTRALTCAPLRNRVPSPATPDQKGVFPVIVRELVELAHERRS